MQEYVVYGKKKCRDQSVTFPVDAEGDSFSVSLELPYRKSPAKFGLFTVLHDVTFSHQPFYNR